MLATFTGYDWLIVIAYVIAGTLPAFLLRKYIRHQDDFLVAGRTLSVFLATATLTATELGLITVMYFAELGFRHGFSAFSIGVIALVTTLFVGLTGFLVSGFRASGVTTVAEYYEKRYSRGVRLLGGFILAAAGILNYGVFLRVEATFVRILTGVPERMVLSAPDAGWNVNVPGLELVMSILVLIVLSYTLLGGMVSVVVTDYVQFIVLTVGMGVTTWLVLSNPQTGGVAGMVHELHAHRPGYGLNPFTRLSAPGPDGKTILLGLGGIYVTWQIMQWTVQSCWQTQAFRTAAADSPRTAKAMWTMTSMNYFGRAIVPMLWGVGALAFFARQGADLDSIKPPEAMPNYLAAVLPAGISGLLVAGMLAAMMSTHSAYLLAWSGVLTEDLIAPVARTVGRPLGDRARLWITRVIIVFLGAYLVIFGLWYELKGAIWTFLALTGTMYFAGAGALLGFGLYWRRANKGGAYAGLLCGALPGAISISMYVASLIIQRYVANREYGPLKFILAVNEWLDEPTLGLISFPLGALAMIVGSIVYERRRGGREEPGSQTDPLPAPLEPMPRALHEEATP